MPHKTNEAADSDPSFISTNTSELVSFARRLGLSNDQVRDAVDSGLIKPATVAKPRPAGQTDENTESPEPSDSAF